VADSISLVIWCTKDKDRYLIADVMPKRIKKKAATRKKPKQVKPIPSGFRSVTPYLVVNNASAAIEFYKKAFGAKELSRNPTPDGKILNAQIKIGDSMVMVSDEYNFPGSPMKSPTTLGGSTVTVHLYSKDVNKLFAQAVAAGASVLSPLDNTFWGERYGYLIDPFGHSWSLSQAINMNPKELEEKQKAAMAMFAQGERPGRSENPPGGVG
jgi:PhnB protein